MSHGTIWTWEGCVLEVDTDNVYIEEESEQYFAMMSNVLKLVYMCLVKLRNGPITISLLGNKLCGKSTLATMLQNYMTRKGIDVIYCDLDFNKSSGSILYNYISHHKITQLVHSVCFTSNDQLASMHNLYQ